MGLLNRIIIEDLYVEDQQQTELLKVARLAARFDIMALFKGKISINNVQLFGFDLKLAKEKPTDELNLQFIIDAFESPEKQKETSLDLRINSLLIRRGKLSYNINSIPPESKEQWDSNHLQIDNIIANISLKALRKDTINADIKRLSFTENSGFELKKLAVKVVGNQDKMDIEHLKMALPHTTFGINSMSLGYNGISSFADFADKVEFSLATLPSYVTLADFKSFVPLFSNFNEKIDLAIEANGTINQLQLSRLAIDVKDHIEIIGEGTVDNLSQPRDAFIMANLSQLRVSQEGVDFLLRNLSNNYRGIPPVLQRLGHIRFKGELSGYFSDMVTYGEFTTDLGSIRTDVKLTSTSEIGRLDYSGAIQTKDFEIGTLANSDDFGLISLNVEIKGEKLEARNYPNLLVRGEIEEIDFKEYNYENISIDGHYKEGGFDGALNLDDPNGALQLIGSFNLAQPVPSFNFAADIIDVRPYHLHLTQRDEEALFSIGVSANFTGGSLDEMNGEININNLKYTDSQKNYTLDNFKIKAIHNDTEDLLVVDSKFLKAKVDGSYSYQTVWNSFLNTAQKYLPSLSTPKKKKDSKPNNFSFTVDLIDTEILTHLFDFPLQTYTHSTINGYFNDKEQKLHIEGHFPKFRYKNQFYESTMFLFENPSDKLTAHVRMSQQKKMGAVNVSLNAIAKADSITTSIHWGNNGPLTYSGNFNTETMFSRIKNKDSSYLQTEVNVLPSNVILNDTTWQIHPAYILAGKDEITVDNFKFTNDKQFLHIDGKVSAEAKDTLKLNLNDIDIGYVFEITDFRDVDFKGKATGYGMLSQLYSEPQMNAKLNVNNFSFNDGVLGDMDIYSFWDNTTEGIFLDADMNQDDIGFTKVTGFVYPSDPKNGLDLAISANGTNVEFLDFYLGDIASEVDGRAYGDVRLYGKFSGLNLVGDLKADASLRINVLETSFALNDTLRFDTTGIHFNQVAIADLEGHYGKFNGKLNYKHFGDLRYSFNVNTDNMLVMDLKESADLPFYGKIYATGQTAINGDADGLVVDAAITTNRNTQFTYITNATATATSSQFIQFNDLTPHRAYKDTVQLSIEEYMTQHSKNLAYEEEGDIRVNLEIEATPDANVRIIMDQISGDYLSVNGSGNIRTTFYNKGDVGMFGSYQINRGVYKFSLQEVIRKDFTIRDGSNISFNGSPIDGSLNIRAQHTVNSVSLSDLIPFDSETLVSQPHIKVNCLLDLTGPIARPNISFELDLPNEREETQTLVKNYISTEEQLNMQVLYLLGIGKFYTADNTNVQSSDMMSSVLSSTISGQLNDLLSHFTNNSNWSLGTNLSTGYKGWTDVEVEGILSAQLLNNRLLINGNFGYRDNPMATTNFVGDFEAEWLLTRSGNIRLRAYSRTNDQYISRTNQSTQGIGIMFRKDYMNWRELLWWNTIRDRRKARKLEKEKEEAIIRQQAEEEKKKELEPIE